jgi:hypothetical protein
MFAQVLGTLGAFCCIPVAADWSKHPMMDLARMQGTWALTYWKGQKLSFRGQAGPWVKFEKNTMTGLGADWSISMISIRGMPSMLLSPHLYGQPQFIPVLYQLSKDHLIIVFGGGNEWPRGGFASQPGSEIIDLVELTRVQKE